MFFSISTAASRGCRAHMEDRMIVEQLRNEAGKLIGIFVAVLDGHGGVHASEHVQSNLWKTFKSLPGFHSNNDFDVLEALKKTFLIIHDSMKEARESWPSRAKGFPSTAGTTCSCAFIKNSKLYTAHCGDSRISLLSDYQNALHGVDLTKDHKPDDEIEYRRIKRSGGQVSLFSAVPRVMWTRSYIDDEGNSKVETIPFLSIARSLGDYWSYNESQEEYVVSPMPDCAVKNIESSDRYLILMTDGITHVLNSSIIAQFMEVWWQMDTTNFAREIIRKATRVWRNLRADNMSVICVGLHQDDEIDPYDELESSTLLGASDLMGYMSQCPTEILMITKDECRAVVPVNDERLDVTPEDDEEVNCKVEQLSRHRATALQARRYAEGIKIVSSKIPISEVLTGVRSAIKSIFSDRDEEHLDPDGASEEEVEKTTGASINDDSSSSSIRTSVKRKHSTETEDDNEEPTVKVPTVEPCPV